jgi:hypothetical protein
MDAIYIDPTAIAANEYMHQAVRNVRGSVGRYSGFPGGVARESQQVLFACISFGLER